MKLNTEILEEAANWLIDLHSGEASPHTRQQFDDWLRRSPEHLRAYFELLPVWEDGASLPVKSKVSVEELIAMGRRGDPNVVPLGAPFRAGEVSAAAADASMPASATYGSGHGAGWSKKEESTRTPRFQRRWLALAASTLFVSMATGLTWQHFFQGRYSTDVGEQRSLTLEDGSSVQLNARSRIRVRYTAQARTVELLQGQALFRVAKNLTKPFIVDTGEMSVRAVGTEFDVYKKPTGTVVTVLEGRVAVASEASQRGVEAPARAETFPPSEPARSAGKAPRASSPPVRAKAQGSGKEVLLSAGEQLTITAVKVFEPKPVNIATVTAWTQRRLVFDDSTLGEVVEEFNRYNERRLVILDPALRSFPITAAFSSPDPASLVRFLETQPTLSVATTGHEIQISSGR